jgi:uncharacterized protein
MSAGPTTGAETRPAPPTKKKQRGPRPKHVPQRTCVVCRTSAPKRSFIRVVRLPSGEVIVDPTGKKSGRGASVCGTRACWTKATAGTLLDRALRVEIGAADRAALRDHLSALPDEAADEASEP